MRGFLQLVGFGGVSTVPRSKLKISELGRFRTQAKSSFSGWESLALFVTAACEFSGTTEGSEAGAEMLPVSMESREQFPGQ
jgi:hypothetical protein